MFGKCCFSTAASRESLRVSAGSQEEEKPNTRLEHFLGFSTTIPAGIAPKCLLSFTVRMQLCLSVTMEMLTLAGSPEMQYVWIWDGA